MDLLRSLRVLSRGVLDAFVLGRLAILFGGGAAVAQVDIVVGRDGLRRLMNGGERCGERDARRQFRFWQSGQGRKWRAMAYGKVEQHKPRIGDARTAVQGLMLSQFIQLKLKKSKAS